MTSAAVMMKFPLHKLPGSVSQSHRDVTEERYRDLRRPRKVVFFCNGDRYFKGKRLNITPHRYLTFNDLLFDLTGKLPGGVHLPYGVRQIYTPVGGRRVREIEDLQDGSAYVCAGFEPFKTVRYGTEMVQPWSIGKPHLHEFYGVSPEYGNQPGATSSQRGFQNAFQPHRVLRQTYPYRKHPGTFGQRAGHGSFWNQHGAEGAANQAMRPRMVTVVRHGPSKPRAVVKMLLNRRSVQSYEQMMKDIADAFGPNWKNNKVRKLFSIKGKEVQGVSDFFREDDVFIGVGNESLTVSDVQEILEEVYPDSPYAKNVLKEWERPQKKRHRVRVEGDTSLESQKKDSGLGSDGSNKDDGDDVIYKGHNTVRKYAKYPYANEPDMVVRLERERQRAAMDERERANKRMQKRIEAEQKALDEEKKKRGLGKKEDRSSKQETDTYRSDHEQASKERRERKEKKKSKEQTPPTIVVIKGNKDDSKKKSQAEAEAKKKKELAEEKQRQKELEDKKKAEEEEREKVLEEERRKAREDEERKIAKEREIAEERRKERERVRKNAEEEDRKKKEREDKEREEAARKKRELEEIEQKKLEDEQKEREVEEEKERELAEERKAEEDAKRKAQEEEDTQKRKKKAEEEDTQKRKKEAEEKERRKLEQEEIKESEPAPKKKAKSKIIIKKSKMERQISNLQHVMDKYEPGKVLGDGNFAVVRQCQLKNIGSEYAMKIIDKSKLKGKEHMIENEIGVMKVCNHPNIVKLNEEFETKDEIYLIMELVKGGDLFDAITQSVKFNEHDASGMTSDLTQALFYLHSRSVIHRDMKPENLLVCRNKDGTITLKLADFGLAMEVKEPIYTVCGTPTYVAPEILSEIGYSLEVDMWALGVITYILLCGFPPFRSPDRNQTELFEFIKAGEYEFLSPYWDNISKSAKDLIERLLIVEKKKRYTAIDVLCHPWIITQGGAIAAPENMEQHRKNLRKELELQAKNNLESFRAHANT